MADIDPKHLFTQLVKNNDKSIDLATAALLIAKNEYPELNIDFYTQLLNEYAHLLNRKIKRIKKIQTKINIINDFLFDELKYRGNKENYYDPKNSFLNDVIDRRLGIPITLSLVYIEIGKRLGMNFSGIGLPGHFMVGHPHKSEMIYIDPFNEGIILTAKESWEKVCEVYNKNLPMDDNFLKPVSNKDILVRILRNLKGIYIQQNDQNRFLETINWIFIIDPDSAIELRERGIFYFKRYQYSDALNDFRNYLKSEPEINDRKEIEYYIDSILGIIARYN